MTPTEEENKRILATKFAERVGMPLGSAPPPVRLEEMTKAERDQHEAAQFVFEYQFYRNVSNFPHHVVVAQVESNRETVACRKMFYKAERLNLTGSPRAALEAYQSPVDLPSWGGYKISDPRAAILYSAVWSVAGPRATVADRAQSVWLTGMKTEQKRPPSPLEAWRDLVLIRNKDYRIDPNNQEITAEFQIRYLLLYNRRTGKDLKEGIGKMAKFLPLVPKFTHDTFRPPVFVGPFDYKVKETQVAGGTKVELLPLDSLEDGFPLVEQRTMDTAMERMRLPVPRRQKGPPPG